MGRSRLIAALSFLCLGAALAAFPSAEGDESPWSEAAVRTRFPDPDAGASADDFADNSECRECHEKQVASLATSFHRTLGNAKKSGTHGCQECHGPAGKHVDDGGDSPIRNPLDTVDREPRPPAPPPPEGGEPRPRTPVTVKAMNGVCLRCHAAVLTKPVEGHREWLGRTRLASGERSCVSCHFVHVDASKPPFDKSVGPFPTAARLAERADAADPAKCLACHTEAHPEMARSGHAFLAREGPDHGCAACHGNGSLHVESGGDRRKILLPTDQRAADVNATCNVCHSGGNSTQKWTCSEHSLQGLSCIECHDPNAPRGRTLRDPAARRGSPVPEPRGAELALCGKCHVDVAVKFDLKNRHRVAEGRMGCSDCHDPHGNTDKVRDRDVAYRACISCHQEKAGPFLFDHGIKRGEGCIACHDPHGSTNRRMLTYARVQPLCMQCHPETPHDLRRHTYDNCLSCHTEVHGSHLDRTLLK